MKYCTHCGAPLEEDARFCANCGHPAAAPEPTKTQTPETSDRGPVREEPLHAPAQEAPAYENTAWGGPAGFENSNFGAAPQMPAGYPPAPKKKKSLTWLWILLGVLGAAAIAVTVWLCFFRPQPVRDLSSAVAATAAEKEDLLKNCPNLKKIGEFPQNPDNLGRTELAFTEDDTSFRIETLSAMDTEKDTASFDVNFRISEDGNELPFRLQIYMDGEEMQLALPDLLSDTFAFPLEEAGVDAGWMDAYEDLGTSDWADALTVTETAEAKIFMDGREKRCQVYEVEMSPELLAVARAFVYGIEPDMETVTEMEAQNYRFVVSDGFLRGVIFDVEVFGDTQTVEFLMQGEENPMRDVCIRLDGDEIFRVCSDVTEQGFDMRVSLADQEIMSAGYEDSTGTFRFGMGEEEIRIRFTMTEDRLNMDLSQEGGDVSLSFGPNPGAVPEKISRNPVHLDDLSDREIQRIAAEIITALAMNPDTQWIVEDSLLP